MPREHRPSVVCQITSLPLRQRLWGQENWASFSESLGGCFGVRLHSALGWQCAKVCVSLIVTLLRGPGSSPGLQSQEIKGWSLSGSHKTGAPDVYISAPRVDAGALEGGCWGHEDSAPCWNEAEGAQTGVRTKEEKAEKQRKEREEGKSLGFKKRRGK